MERRSDRATRFARWTFLAGGAYGVVAIESGELVAHVGRPITSSIGNDGTLR
jgi:hypothetical protein